MEAMEKVIALNLFGGALLESFPLGLPGREFLFEGLQRFGFAVDLFGALIFFASPFLPMIYRGDYRNYFMSNKKIRTTND